MSNPQGTKAIQANGANATGGCASQTRAAPPNANNDTEASGATGIAGAGGGTGATAEPGEGAGLAAGGFGEVGVVTSKPEQD